MDAEYILSRMTHLQIPIRDYWVTGGRGGGSCYNDGEHYSLEAATEPDNPIIDLLVDLCPTLTIKDYSEIMKDLEHPLISYTNHTEYEYYGNHTCYCYRIIEVRNIVYHLSRIS